MGEKRIKIYEVQAQVPYNECDYHAPKMYQST